MRDEPCANHTSFSWSCDNCKNNYQKAKYHNLKNKIKYCKVCKKDVMRVTYERHKRSKNHQAIREALRKS